jgi:anthranilate phosphoribosyltransferase
MAPRHHSATRHVAGTRVELATRTIFNILGPLSNPAEVKRLVVGVYALELVEPLAQVLGKLGAEKAWVVHGSDGLDELTTTGPSTVASLEGGVVKTFEVSPEDAGLPLAKAEGLLGGDGTYNANAMNAMLSGEKSAFRDIVLLSASAALVVADKASDLKEGAAIAASSIDSGKAKAALEAMARITNESN